MSLFENVKFTAEDAKAYHDVAECYARAKGPEALAKFEAADKIEQETAVSRSHLEALVVLSIVKAKANLMVSKMQGRRMTEEPLLDNIDAAATTVEQYQRITTKRILHYSKMTPENQSRWWPAVYHVNCQLEQHYRHHEDAKKEHADWQAKYEAEQASIEERDDLWITRQATEALIQGAFTRWSALTPAQRAETAAQLMPAAEAADAANKAWNAFLNREKKSAKKAAKKAAKKTTSTDHLVRDQAKITTNGSSFALPPPCVPLDKGAAATIDHETTDKTSEGVVSAPTEETVPDTTDKTSEGVVSAPTADQAPASDEEKTLVESEETASATTQETTTIGRAEEPASAPAVETMTVLPAEKAPATAEETTMAPVEEKVPTSATQPPTTVGPLAEKSPAAVNATTIPAQGNEDLEASKNWLKIASTSLPLLMQPGRYGTPKRRAVKTAGRTFRSGRSHVQGRRFVSPLAPVPVVSRPVAPTQPMPAN